MRRLPIPELLMVGVVVFAYLLVADAEKAARHDISFEKIAIRFIGRLDGAGPVPDELRPVPGTVAREHDGYYYVGYLPGEEAPRTVDVREAVASGGPYCILAWPRQYHETGRRTYLLRSPGYVLRSDNELRTISGLPVPPCPLPAVTGVTGKPIDPMAGAPEDWHFGHWGRQRKRLHPRGLWPEHLDRLDDVE